MRRCKCVAAWFLTVILTLSLAGCGSGKLNGTYASQGLIPQTFTFDGDSVTMSAFGLQVSGKYRVEDGEILINYSMFGQEYTWVQPFSQSGRTIEIGGTAFKK